MKNLFNNGYRTLNRYLFLEFFFSFVVSFLFFFIIFFVNQILLLAEQILSYRVPLKYVLKLVLYSLPTILALTFPFATLVGALMSVGRLSTDNEILAMQCAGISLKRISIPFLIIGCCFAVISFSINDYLIPLGNIKYKRLYREIFTSNPTLELDSWSVRQMDNTILVTGEVAETSVDQMVIIEKNQNGRRMVITATGAEIHSGEELGDMLSIELDQVESLSTYSRETDRYSYTNSLNMVYNFPLSELSEAISEPSPSELRSVDLFRGISEKREVFLSLVDSWKRGNWIHENQLAMHYSRLSHLPATELQETRQLIEGSYRHLSTAQSRKPQDRTLDFWQMEFYQKFAIPFSCIPFVILAFPLGILSRRSGKTFGFIFGLGLTFLYWAFLIVGRSLVMRSGISPFLSIWTSNILLLVTGAVIYLRRTKQ